jgi:DNA-binding protein H-NS
MKNSDFEEFLNALTPDEIIEFANRMSDKVEDAKVAGDIQAWLKIEKILEDRGMDTKDLKNLTVLKNHVKELRSKKYSDGKGNFWSGRGKRPAWVAAELDAGKSLDELKYENDDILPLNKQKQLEVKK